MNTKYLWGLFLILFSPNLVKAQWSNNPAINNPICTDIHLQQRPQIVSDSKDGAMICWMDQRDAPGALYGDIYVQRIKKDGTLLWTNNGVALTSLQEAEHPKMVPDGNGGVIIVWIDHRNGTANNEEADVFAQRIDSLGNPLWASGGIAIARESNFTCARIDLLTDGSGGVFITWDANQGTMNSNKIFAQHLSNNGQLLWGNTNHGVQVSTSNYSYDAYQPKIASDGNGGIVVCWYDNRTSGKDKIYAQRLDANGHKKWTTNDLNVYSNYYSDAHNAVILSSSEGKVIIVWDDTRTGTSLFSWNIYGQELDSMGNLLWQSEGFPLTHAAYNGRFKWPQITSDNQGGAFVSFFMNTSTPQLLMQHLNSNGSTTWTDSLTLDNNAGYVGSSLFEENNNINFLTHDGQGNAVTSWGGNSGLQIQKVTIAGELLWNQPGDSTILPSISALHPQNTHLIAQENGVVIIVWQDSRADEGNIYADKLPREIVPTAIQYIESPTSFNLYPNPTPHVLNIKLDEANPGVASIYDMLGRLVKTFNLEQSTTSVDISDLPEGFYNIKIQISQHIWNKMWIKGAR